MSDYNYTATDDDDEHGERYGVATLTVEYDPLTGRALEGTEAELSAAELAELAALDAAEAATLAATVATVAAVRKAAARTVTTRVKVICSCGHYTCAMVRRFGHPEPVYQDEIKPLPSQYTRDLRALELHAAS